jgi:hypothetical protein
MGTTSRSQAAFASEHATLNEILMGMMECRDLPTVIDAFDSLEPVLRRHIQGEEAPGGLVSMLVGATVVPDAVRRIREDHREFLGAVAELRHEARSMLTDDFCADYLSRELRAMRARVIGFSDAILTHEKYETKMYMSVLDLRAERPGAEFRR